MSSISVQALQSSVITEEREKHYISFSHLGLIRCLSPIRVSAIIYTQTFCDKLGNPVQITRCRQASHVISCVTSACLQMQCKKAHVPSVWYDKQLGNTLCVWDESRRAHPAGTKIMPWWTTLLRAASTLQSISISWSKILEQ